VPKIVILENFVELPKECVKFRGVAFDGGLGGESDQALPLFSLHGWTSKSYQDI
jgi:hypothetical protein